MKRVLLVLAVVVGLGSLASRDVVGQDHPREVAVVDSKSVVMAVQGLG